MRVLMVSSVGSHQKSAFQIYDLRATPIQHSNLLYRKELSKPRGFGHLHGAERFVLHCPTLADFPRTYFRDWRFSGLSDWGVAQVPEEQKRDGNFALILPTFPTPN